MTDTLDDVKAAILAAQAEQEKANAAAAKAAAAAARVNEAEEIAEAARQARELAWAEQQIAAYDADVAAGLDAIRRARESFYRMVVDDLPSAMRTYLEWRLARERLWLRWQDQGNALALRARANGTTVDQNLTNPLPSFDPAFDAALNEAVMLRVRDVVGQLHEEHEATVREQRGMEQTMANDALDPGPNGDYPYFPRDAAGRPLWSPPHPEGRQIDGATPMPRGTRVQNGVLIDLTPRQADGSPVDPPTIEP